MDQSTRNELFESLTMELRRGTIVLGVLSQLKTPQYGYALVESLQSKGMNVDAGTLYPLLRRLEKQEILVSSWDTEGNKPRKYYALSIEGKQLFRELTRVYLELQSSIQLLLDEKEQG